MPKAPPPPGKDSKCGGFGQIFVAIVAIVVAVVVSIYMPAASGPMMAMAKGAVVGAASSVAAQGAAMAIGLQDSFSWSQLGMSVVGGAVAGGLGEALKV